MIFLRIQLNHKLLFFIGEYIQSSLTIFELKRDKILT